MARTIKLGKIYSKLNYDNTVDYVVPLEVLEKTYRVYNIKQDAESIYGSEWFNLLFRLEGGFVIWWRT